MIKVLSTPRADEPYTTQTVSLEGADFRLTFRYNFQAPGWLFDVQRVDGSDLITGRRIEPNVDLKRLIHDDVLTGVFNCVSLRGLTRAPLIDDFENGNFQLAYLTKDEFGPDPVNTDVPPNWTPLSLGTALWVWADPSQASHITQVTGKVSAVPNQGILGGSFTQTTVDRRPAPSTEFNAPGLRFTEAKNQFLTFGTLSTLSNLLEFAGGDFEVWAVARRTNDTGGATVFANFLAGPVPAPGFLLWLGSSDIYALVGNTAGNPYLQAVDTTDTEVDVPYILRAQGRPSVPSLTIEVNERPAVIDSTTTGTLANSAGANAILIGGQPPSTGDCDGHIGQIIVTNRLLDTTEAANMRAWLGVFLRP